MTTIPTAARSTAAETARTLTLVVLLVGASLTFSRALACATPFAALATVAGTRLRWREALTAMLLAWSANQAIGFGLLHYPHTATTLAWGVAIGLAACAAGAVASTLSSWAEGRGLGDATWRAAVVLVASYVAYEGVLLAATTVLPASHAAFAPAVIVRILGINLAACAVLMIVRHGVERFGVAPQALRSRPVGG